MGCRVEAGQYYGTGGAACNLNAVNQSIFNCLITSASTLFEYHNIMITIMIIFHTCMYLHDYFVSYHFVLYFVY